MSYSYGRALQQSALKFWSKNIQDIEGTQKVFNHRAKMNILAAQGKWSKDLENLIKKKFIYLISPSKIKKSFYSDLENVLKQKKTSFFQLRIKKEISKKS